MPTEHEEYERLVASWEVDSRILQHEINEMRAEAEFLRKQDHDFPAEVMDQAADKAQAMVDDARARLIGGR